MTADELASTAATHLNLANTVLKDEAPAVPLRHQVLSRYFTPYRPHPWNSGMPNFGMPKFRRWDRIRYGIRRHFDKP